MVQVIVKRHKENSKSRRMRERGEHYALTKAKCDADRLLARKIDAAFTKLSEGCSPRVMTAVIDVPIRQPELEVIEVKKHTKIKSELGLHAAGRQKMRGHSIPLI